MTTNLEMPLGLSPDAPRPAAVDIRYSQIGMVHVRIHTTDPGAILDELTGRIAITPHFFRRTPVCLDLAVLKVPPQAAEVQGVIEALRRAGMLAVGLSGDAAALAPASMALNMPVLSSARAAERTVPILQPVMSAGASTPTSASTLRAPAAAAPGASAPSRPASPSLSDAPDLQGPSQSAPALIHSQPVRSGQRVYGRHRDLVITSGVGAGAEVMADGCVHVYGALRGRAMAGMHGDLSARVFCTEFHAELVGIAGVFRVFETIPADLSGAPVQAWLSGETLHFSRIGG